MTSRLNTMMERIASIQLGISIPDSRFGGGTQFVTSAFAYQPSKVNTALCPFFVNEMHGGPTNFLATGGLQWVQDDIKMYLCVQRKEAGTDLSMMVEEAERWRDAIFVAFAQKIRLGNDLDFILDAVISEYDVIDYDYGDVVYMSVYCKLTVREAFILTIAP